MTDTICVHGVYADHLDQTGREVVGVTSLPLADDMSTTAMEAVMGPNSDVVNAVKPQSPEYPGTHAVDFDNDPEEDLRYLATAVYETHPIYSKDRPFNELILINPGETARHRWDHYATADDWDEAVEWTVPDDELTGDRRFAVHYVHGQDLHIPLRLLAIVEAATIRGAVRKAWDSDAHGYTQRAMHPNWKVDVVEITAERRFSVEPGRA